jgi:hypothetical protein
LNLLAYITFLLRAICVCTTSCPDAKWITTLYYCICHAHWFDFITSKAHLSLLEGKLIIIPIETPDFTTTNVKYWYQEYKGYVRLVWRSHPVFTPTVIFTYNLMTLRQYVNNFVVSFTTMLLVLFYWLLYLILRYILLFLCHMFYSVNIFGIPNMCTASEFYIPTNALLYTIKY